MRTPDMHPRPNGQASDLIAWLRSQQRFAWTPEPGVTFTLRRPDETEVPTLRQMLAYLPTDPPRGDIGIEAIAMRRVWADLIASTVVDWAGVTEEHIKGRGIGNTSVVAHTPDLCSMWLRAAHADWLVLIHTALLDEYDRWAAQREAAAGNSAPSSTAATPSARAMQ